MGKSDYKLKTVSSVLTERIQAMCGDSVVTLRPDGSAVYKVYSYSFALLILGAVFVYVPIDLFIFERVLSTKEVFGGSVFGLAGIAMLVRALHRGDLIINTRGITIARHMFGLKHELILPMDLIDSVDVVHVGEYSNSGQDLFAVHVFLKSGKRYRWMSCSGTEYDMNMVRDIILCYKDSPAGSEGGLSRAPDEGKTTGEPDK